MKNNHPYLTEYNYFIMKYNETKDIKYALEIINMLNENKLNVSVKHDGKLYFTKHSKQKSKCQYCQKYYLAGTPCFFKDGKGWHTQCASDEDKQNLFYLKWVETDEAAEYFLKQNS